MPVISESLFQEIMHPFEQRVQHSLAVGVSGGADSLFLLLALHKWCDVHHVKLYALTVNHNLRAEAAIEAQMVDDLCKKIGVEHHTLTWQGAKPKTRVEEQAREIRYQLLLDFCKKNNIQTLAIAHHQSDQTETFFARLARGSGLDGLCAISPVVERNGITLIRPLLNTPKSDIVETLNQRQVNWIEDPMNRDTIFERVRWRQNLATLKKMGLAQTSICLSVERLNRAKDALNFYAEQFIQKSVWVDNRGFARVDKKAFFEAPAEIQVRVLSRLINLIGQPKKTLSLDSVEKAIKNLTKQTLGECHIITNHNGIFIAKESVRQEKGKIISACCWTKWDRFWIWADKEVYVSAGHNVTADKHLPLAVRSSFPVVEVQKRLENNTKNDYNNCTLFIHFTPKDKG